MTTPAVVALHLQHYTLDPDGYIGSRGASAHAASKGLVANVARVFAAARDVGAPVVHVGLGFDEDYTGMNAKLPIFAGMRAAGEIKLGSRSAEFAAGIAPEPADIVLHHSSLSPFSGTPLDRILVGLGVDHLLLFGVSVRWVVEGAVYDSLDRGYGVSVISDCSAASDEDLYQASLASLRSYGEVLDTGDAIAKYLSGGGSSDA